MNIEFILICTAAFSLSITYINTSFAFSVRAIGALASINAKSSNLSQALLIINSFFIAITLSIIGYLLDIGIEIIKLNFLFILTLIIILFGHLLMLLKFNFFQMFIEFLIKKYFKEKLKTSKIEYSLLTNKHINTIIFIAWTSYLVGFIFPSFLASYFNEYRTTLFQLSFVFNSLGTFLTILIIEKKASILADQISIDINRRSKIMEYLGLVLLNRAYSSIFVLIGLVFINFYNLYL